MSRLIPGLLLFSVACTGVVEEYNKVLEEGRAELDKISISSISYSGDSLANIEFPLGGTGTGSLYLGGRGDLRRTDIPGLAESVQNHPGLLRFLIRTEKSDGSSDLRVLEGSPVNNSSSSNHYATAFSGISRFKNCRFRPEYPFAYLTLSDPASPVMAVLEAWSPFIPLDAENSSLPVAVFNWTLTNTSTDTLDVSVLLAIQNPFSPQKGKNLTDGTVSYFESDTLSGLRFLQETPSFGEFLVFSNTPSNIRTRWFPGSPGDMAEVFLNDFYNDGELDENRNTCRFTNAMNFGSLNKKVTLLPEGVLFLSYYVNWLTVNSKTMDPVRVPPPFSTSSQHAARLTHNLKNLYSSSADYRNILFSSSYPVWVIDALASGTASIKENFPFSPGLNTPVNNPRYSLRRETAFNPFDWQYAQTLFFLFPDLAEQLYPHLTNPSASSFESMDSRFISILERYGMWKYAGKTEDLNKSWPVIKEILNSGERMVNHSLTLADRLHSADTTFHSEEPNKSPNAYGVHFQGLEMYTLSLYLASLKAAAELATALNDSLSARKYRINYLSEKPRIDEPLWNGEYYIQHTGHKELPPADLYDPSLSPGSSKYQTWEGCFSAQLAGQFYADLYGLGDILDSIRIKQALKSVYRYNYIRDFSGKSHVQRVFATGRESGLVLCSWPAGERPLFAFPYADEVWSGSEYQVAAGLIYRGMTQQGLDLVKSVRDRYRGFNRNPMSESGPEGNAIRAMSGWAVLTALSGYQYDHAAHSLSFNPAINQRNFKTFWSTADAWGSFQINGKGVVLKVAWGSLTLKEFGFNHPDESNILEMVPANASLVRKDKTYLVNYPEPLTLKAGKQLMFTLE
jgi:uncharacterized protein (DUF608 family)